MPYFLGFGRFGLERNGHFMMLRQRRLILAVVRRYALIQNRLFGLVQFFAINTDVKIIKTARSNSKLHLAFSQLPDGFLSSSDQRLA